MSIRPTRALAGFVRGFKRKSSGQIKSLQLETQRGSLKVKLPKALRELAALELDIDAEVRIWLDPRAKRPRAIYFVPLRPKAIVLVDRRPECLKVCLNKHCCRQGGLEILHQLQAELGQRNVEVKGCGCLSNCRNGPNVLLDGKVRQVPVADVSRFVDAHFPVIPAVGTN